MCWFAITPVIGGGLLKSERFWAHSDDAGTGRAMGRLDERFEANGHAYAALRASYRVDRLGLNPKVPPVLTSDTLLGTVAPEVSEDGRVTAVWEPRRGGGESLSPHLASLPEVKLSDHGSLSNGGLAGR